MGNHIQIYSVNCQGKLHLKFVEWARWFQYTFPLAINGENCACILICQYTQPCCSHTSYKPIFCKCTSIRWDCEHVLRYRCNCTWWTKFCRFLQKHEGIVVHNLEMFLSLNSRLRTAQLISAFVWILGKRIQKVNPSFQAKEIVFVVKQTIIE